MLEKFPRSVAKSAGVGDTAAVELVEHAFEDVVEVVELEVWVVDSLDVVVREVVDEVDGLEVVLVVEAEDDVDSVEVLITVELLFELVAGVVETEEVWAELEPDCPWVSSI
jgi:hypothetical protein